MVNGHDEEDPVETQARLLKTLAKEVGMSTQSEIAQHVSGNAQEFFADLKLRAGALRPPQAAKAMAPAESFILVSGNCLIRCGESHEQMPCLLHTCMASFRNNAHSKVSKAFICS